MTYAMSNPLHGTKQYMCVVVKSMIWPGAMSYFWQGQWGEIYMGDGQKHEDVTYFPVQPPPIQEDPVEVTVHPEPNPVRDGEIPQHEELIAKTVEAVWGQYDKDGNGFLDKEECFAFVKDSLKEMG